MKKILPFAILLIMRVALFGQMPACMTIDPPNASAYDSLTLTFDPAFACYQWNSLAGVPMVYMHSGVTIGGIPWQYVIEYNGIGANGQLPLLTPNGNGTYSIHYRPSSFYGLPPGLVVTQLCLVFNDGMWGSKDGRDFVPGQPQCTDIYVPLGLGPPKFNFIVNMEKAFEDGIFDPLTDSVFVALQDVDTVVLAAGTGINQYKYSTLIESGLVTGNTYNYKFRINTTTYETVDRTITANSGMNTAYVWWNDDNLPYTFDVIADFEDNTTGRLSMHVMGCGPWDDPLLHPVGETFSIVDNPFPSGINTSSKVMKFIRRGTTNGGQNWGGFWANCFPSLDITSLKYIHAKAWKPRFSPLRFKIEAGTTGTLEIVSSNQQTLMNEWEDFVFDFTSMDGTYPIVAFMPDFEVPLTLTGDIEIYFDDIVLSDKPYQILTGTALLNSEKINIFPNPAHDLVTLAGNQEFQRICIYDVMGRIKKEIRNKVEKGNIRINVSDLTAGVYIISLVDANGIQSFTKLMKE
jgi:hypothetical protein